MNLSRLHLRVPGTAQRLHDMAQEHGVPPELLEFELTETIMLNEFAEAKRFCQQLRGYGYTMSIDDYGAGYAGVNILQELDFDVLKLDRRFVQRGAPSPRNRAILPDILNSLRKLGIDAICEGVETQEQCRYLAEVGCRYVQAYYFSRPVPPQVFYDLYRETGKQRRQ